jgi:DHA2 family multidrug resistance protein
VGVGALQYVLEKGQTDDWFDDATIRWGSFLSVAGLAALCGGNSPPATPW